MEDSVGLVNNPAMSDAIVEPGEATETVRNLLESFEELTGAQLCFRPVAHTWTVLGDHGKIGLYAEHRSPFCLDQKARNLPACMRCDNLDAFTASAGRSEPYLRRCHAGADELLVPLHADATLTGVVFLGQLDEATTSSPERMRTLTAGLDALRARLQEIFATLSESEAVGWHGPRAMEIEEYLRETLSRGPSLLELAERMGLSVSRAGHVVRETTGESFSTLVERRRMTLARELLTRSSATITWIAEQVGFSDTGYFCRYFKERAGATPTEYRRRHGRPVPV